MKKIILLFAYFFIIDAYAEDWITEEVLKQLSEVRQELKVLQQEVKSLKEIIKPQPKSVKLSDDNGVLNVSNAPSLGKRKATIAVVEFSDYQCGYCKRHFLQTFPEIKRNYIDTGQIQYFVKQFPLDFHKKAHGAAVAALCMEKLKKDAYWKAHHSMFKGEVNFAKTDYIAFADSFGLNKAQFERCLDNPKVSVQVNADMQQGSLLGVRGTPAFFIGKLIDGKVVDGKLLTGARPYEAFSAAIERLKEKV